jgi:hypothetical protein
VDRLFAALNAGSRVTVLLNVDPFGWAAGGDRHFGDARRLSVFAA